MRDNCTILEKRTPQKCIKLLIYAKERNVAHLGKLTVTNVTRGQFHQHSTAVRCKFKCKSSFLGKAETARRFLFWIWCTGVNFINVKHTNFSYKCRFGSFYNVHVTRKKLPKWHSYEKFARLTLMKLTPGHEEMSKNRQYKF